MSTTKKNVITSLLLQIVTILCGLVIPRAIISTFGSEVNGLVSSINQFLNYVNLLEGGVSGVISASLYKPLVQHDQKKLSGVIRASQSVYFKIGIIFDIYTAALAFLYPIFVRSTFSYTYIFLLILILSINVNLQYFFSITWRILLNADRKVYITSIISIIITVLNALAVVILTRLFPSIHVIKLVSALIFLIQPIFYNRYVKKNYEIDKNAEPDKKALSQRWDGFGINVAAYIHNNTDAIVLSIFNTLRNVSVYSIHMLVINGIKGFVTAISSALVPNLGQAYASNDRTRLNQNFDLYETVMFLMANIFFSTTGLCISPFITLYLNNVSDANYYQPFFAWIMVLAELVYCIRDPYVSLAYAANRFRSFTAVAYIEAGLNVGLSIVLVGKYGIIGVAIGTLISMTFRTVIQIMYLHKHILKRTYWRLFKPSFIFAIAFLVDAFLGKTFIQIGNLSVTTWLLFALKNFVLSCGIFLLAAYLTNKSAVRLLINGIRRK